jgi:serine protease
VKTALQSSARPFPSTGADNGPSDLTPVGVCQPPSSQEQLQCYCVTGLCGAGMLDSAAALSAAESVPRPVVPVTPPSSGGGGGGGGGAMSWPWLLALALATALLTLLARPSARSVRSSRRP